jgi:hypothetical protein
MRRVVNDGLDALQDDEWLELASNGKMEERTNCTGRCHLDSSV